MVKEGSWKGSLFRIRSRGRPKPLARRTRVSEKAGRNPPRRTEASDPGSSSSPNAALTLNGQAALDIEGDSLSAHGKGLGSHVGIGAGGGITLRLRLPIIPRRHNTCPATPVPMFRANLDCPPIELRQT